MKICTKCNINKSEKDFYFRNKKLNKRRSVCKICSEQSRNSKEHYKKYKKDYLLRNKLRQELLLKNNHKQLLKYLKINSCVDCGEIDPIVLEFDHLDPSNKKYGISKMMRNYTWEQILQEINKCEIVCANCHKKRTAKQFGWYKLKNQN